MTEMGKSEAGTVKTIELTDIVEVGLPLDKLPESGMQPRQSTRADISSEVITPLPGGVAGSESEFADVDDFDIDLDTFDDIGTPENVVYSDPVLDELKSDGLRAEVAAPVTENEIYDSRKMEKLVSDTEVVDLFDDDFNDFDDSLDESRVIGDSVDESKQAQSLQTEGANMELPEDYLEDDEPVTKDTGDKIKSAAQPAPESQVEPEPAFSSPVSPPRPERPMPTAQPHIFTEPQSLDFSQQIEDMTQEWSKQLMQSAYASMDKMIKAIGELAPTIVDQVAREVIPPLAEKVIKAEIARLEEKLVLEEGEAE
jgi:hypothetical protein